MSAALSVAMAREVERSKLPAADVRAFLTGRIENDTRLAEALLEEHGLATVPGTAFGAPGHLRLSFATSEAEIRRGVQRLAGIAAQAA